VAEVTVQRRAKTELFALEYPFKGILMRASTRKIIAGILLTLYIPVAPSLELFHTDEVGGSSLPTQVFTAGNGDAHVAPGHEGPCLACLLAAGHFTQDSNWVSWISFLYYAPCSGTAQPDAPLTVERSARAPPAFPFA
jgi:hypothetical protein